MKVLPRFFYERRTDIVAKELIGKVLYHRTTEGVASGIIVETEAYFGQDDPASHAAKKKTPRNEVMFGAPGHAYVYFCYGAHSLFNVVTEAKGVAGAVLVRGLEPLEGTELMLRRRKVKNLFQTTNGPGKLTEALKINLKQNRQDVTKGDLVIQGGLDLQLQIKQSGRIGIQHGRELSHRYYWAGNPFVSVKPKL